MSHALHRMGTVENLQHDYTIIVRPERGYNDVGSRAKQQKVLRALADCGAVDICSARGAGFQGNIFETSIENIIEGVGEGQSVFAAFDDRDKLENWLRFMAEGDFGLSVVVQGLCENVGSSLQRVGLELHTTNHSLGIWGRRNLLADRKELEITTMCGHGVVSPYLVPHFLEKIRAGQMTVHEAAVEMAKPCVCGIFNTTRAEELLTEML